MVIVQHVDPHFAVGLAAWLDQQTPLQVRTAHEGDHPKPGLVLLAGSENHLVFASATRLTYTREPVECSFRPSVDVFFKSVVRFWPGEVIGVILTGMGRDGAEGLLALHESGHYTIAQDEASCAVYGMPKAAAELRAAREIVALDNISARLLTLLTTTAKSHG
jgi:chemotaxis response regulator CheB